MRQRKILLLFLVARYMARPGSLDDFSELIDESLDEHPDEGDDEDDTDNSADDGAEGEQED